MQIKELSGAFSGISHRDCDLLEVKGPLAELELKYEIESDGSQWKIRFGDTYACRIVSEELVNNHLLSITTKSCSFYEIDSSQWINEFEKNSGRDMAKAQHFVLFFYDEIIEIIADTLIPEQQK